MSFYAYPESTLPQLDHGLELLSDATFLAVTAKSGLPRLGPIMALKSMGTRHLSPKTRPSGGGTRCGDAALPAQSSEVQRPEVHGDATTRNSRLLTLRLGRSPLRQAQRTSSESLTNAPSRNTRRTSSGAARSSRPSSGSQG